MANAFFRGAARGQLRALHSNNAQFLKADWLNQLDLPTLTRSILQIGRPFIDIWSELESLSPRLARRPVYPGELSEQIHSARSLLGRLKGGSLETAFGLDAGSGLNSPTRLDTAQIVSTSVGDNPAEDQRCTSAS